jgi:hypothetical protein
MYVKAPDGNITPLISTLVKGFKEYVNNQILVADKPTMLPSTLVPVLNHLQQVNATYNAVSFANFCE